VAGSRKSPDVEAPGLDRVLTQVRSWRDELVDLTRRNKLLNLPDRGLLTISMPSAAVVVPGLDRGWRFHYPPPTKQESEDLSLFAALEGEDPDLDDRVADDELVVVGASASKLSTSLRALERRSSAEWNDKGIRVLYLAVGALNWLDGPGEERRSPLVMVPVALERTNPREPFRLLGTDEDTVVNPALAVKLEQDFGIALPDFDDDTALATFLRSTKEAVAAQKGWDVTELLVLGTFSFAKEAMYRDLKDNEGQILAHPLIQVLGGGHRDDLAFEPVREGDLDSIAPPEVIPTILDADGTQRQCLQAARDGRSFVMEGPPGTGKSQTIANLIADLMRLGKSVLFVSEKAAALEVVKRRLDGAGLGSYVLELHSHKATRKEVATELGRSLLERPRARKELTGVEASQLRERRTALSTYAQAINERREPLGRSLHSVLGRLGQLHEFVGTPVPAWVDLSLSADQLAGQLDLAAALGRAWGPVARGEDFLWRDLADSARATARHPSIAKALDDALDAAAGLDHEALAMALALELDSPRSDDEIRTLTSVCQHLADRPPVPAAWLSEDGQQRASEFAEELTGPCERRRAAIRRIEVIASNWRAAAPDLWTDAKRIRVALEPQVTLDDQLPVGELAVLIEQIAQSEQALSAASEQVGELADRFGLPNASTSPTRIDELCRLADLAGSNARPERSWLDPVELAAVREATTQIQPMIEHWVELNTQLVTIFNDQIEALDVEAFYDGDGDLVPALSRFNGVGRDHRRQLKAATKSGKIGSQVKDALPTVRAWKKALSAIRAYDSEYARILGPVYWQAERTDVAALSEALGNASVALELLGPQAVPESAAARLARTDADADATAAAGEALRSAHQQRLEAIQNPALSALRTRLDGLSYDDARRDCAAIRHHLGELANRSAEVTALTVAPVTIGQFFELSHLRAEIDEVEQVASNATPRGTAALNDQWQGVDTDWDRVGTMLVWAQQLTHLLQRSVSLEHAERLLSSTSDPGPLVAALATYDKQIETIASEFQPARAAELLTDLATTPALRLALLEQLRDSRGDIDEWHTYVTTIANCQAAGVGEVTDYCLDHRVDADQVAFIFERALLAGWAEHLLVHDARLRPLGSMDHDALVAEFRRLDTTAVELAAARVIEVCNARRPTTTVGQVKIIHTEASKKRKHRPIRQLLTEAGGAAQAIKPCFMMSPLSVSQFLPTGLHFDTVIFDEASQIRPCDAANAIYRGDQLIVAGDDKQLPPTSFFQLGADDDDEWVDDEPEVYESVLGLCRGTAELPALPLRWHYRSQHEALITFSNRQFYGSTLITYPGALDIAPDVGVELIHVADGVYGRGSSKDNAVEARAVVDRIVFHAENHPGLTLGVVAFSEPQATRIAIELEAVRRTRPDLDTYFTEGRLDGFFVKNLENVQGDERDIILFSVGYGRDDYGKLTMNFGPLNRDGGWRRLNVAATRARRRVELISSLTASDLIDPSNYAVKCLKTYLDYADRGAEALAPSPDREAEGETESPFEDDVLAVIRDWGYEAQPQVGHLGYRIDIGVRHPERAGEWALGVECDGTAYHSSLVARDRDRLRQEVLEGLGWRLHRIWGTAWYRNRNTEEERLKAAIEHAIQTSAQPAKSRARRSVREPVVILEESVLDAVPVWTTPYIPYRPGGGFRFNDLGTVASHSDLRADIKDIVAVEGPITKDLLLVRLKEIWNGQNFTAARLRNVDWVIKQLVDSGAVLTLARDVYAQPGQSIALVRRADAFRRDKAAHVPAVELQAAMTHIVSDAHSIDADELSSRTAGVFGWARRGPDIAAALSAALRSLLDDNELRRDDNAMIVLGCG
jgi:hypothetical protein